MNTVSGTEFLRSSVFCTLAGTLVALPAYQILWTGEHDLPGLYEMLFRSTYGWFIPFVVLTLSMNLLGYRMKPLRGALIAAGCVVIYLIYATIVVRFYWGGFLNQSFGEYFGARLYYGAPGAIFVAIGVALSIWITDVFFRLFKRRA